MAAFILAGPVVAAIEEQTLPQRYLAIYLKIDEAEHLEAKEDFRGALEEFEDCYAKLEQIHESDPRWESALVGHRLRRFQGEDRGVANEGDGAGGFQKFDSDSCDAPFLSL